MVGKWGYGQGDYIYKVYEQLKTYFCKSKVTNSLKKNDYPLSAWHLAAAIMCNNNLFTEKYTKRNKDYRVWNQSALNSES